MGCDGLYGLSHKLKYLALHQVPKGSASSIHDLDYKPKNLLKKRSTKFLFYFLGDAFSNIHHNVVVKGDESVRAAYFPLGRPGQTYSIRLSHLGCHILRPIGSRRMRE